MEGKPTVQDVLRQFYPGYLERYTPGAGQAKAAAHILNCKTGERLQMQPMRTYPDT